MNFEDWFKKKYPDLHEAILHDDYVAKKYKQVAKAAYKAGSKHHKTIYTKG